MPHLELQPQHFQCSHFQCHDPSEVGYGSHKKGWELAKKMVLSNNYGIF